MVVSETEIINQLKTKIQSKEYTKIMYNLIYNFLSHRENKKWDLRKTTVVGIGYMVNSNYLVISDEKIFGTDYKNAKSTTQFLLVQNEEGITNLIVLQPINKFKSREVNLLEWWYPVYDSHISGVKNDDNRVFANILEEEIEIEPRAFENPIKFSSLLTQTQLKLNDALVNFIGKDVPPLSQLMAKVLTNK